MTPAIRKRLIQIGFLALLPANVLIACRFSAQQPASPTPALQEEAVYHDIVYLDAPDADPNLNALDTYVPAGASSAPVLVFVHGGGWTQGDKSGVDSKPEAFNAAGYVFVSVNYRLSPAVMHPIHVQDVAAAIAWVYNNIASYGGDPQQIFLLGHSAGAQIVALVATDERRLQAHGLDLSVIKGVVPLDGAGYDIPTRINSPTRGVEELYETAFGTDPAVWIDASPLYHVAAGKNIPPFLLIYAGAREEAQTQAEALAAALGDAGATAELFHAPDKNHMTVNRDLAVGDYVFERMIEFYAGLQK
ncbi:MAG: alpha/beta hydrolase [Anaerolineales bacterium]|nr:alpha/beta hydrolase [Anaerolineales bacterium]